MAEVRLITSESVSEGHPDKMCDQISDAVLDALIAKDRNARVACETLAKTGMVVLAGEISVKQSVQIDYEGIVRPVLVGPRDGFLQKAADLALEQYLKLLEYKPEDFVILNNLAGFYHDAGFGCHFFRRAGRRITGNGMLGIDNRQIDIEG